MDDHAFQENKFSGNFSDSQCHSPFSLNSPGIEKTSGQNLALKPPGMGLMRASTIETPFSNHSARNISLRVEESSGYKLSLNVQRVEDCYNTNSEDFLLSPTTPNSSRRVERGHKSLSDQEVSAQYKEFVRKNIQYHNIIHAYCEDLISSPYEENLQNDVMVGKWLDEIIPPLSKELLALMPEVSKYKVDTTVLDVYKNLLILVGRRYDIEMKLVVGLPHAGNRRGGEQAPAECPREEPKAEQVQRREEARSHLAGQLRRKQGPQVHEEELQRRPADQQVHR